MKTIFRIMVITLAGSILLGLYAAAGLPGAAGLHPERMAWTAEWLAPRALARDLSSRLGGEGGNDPPPPPQAPPHSIAPAASAASPVPVSPPVQELAFTQANPLAADGVGRLLWVESAGSGYAVVGRLPGAIDDFEILYQRKDARATSITVGADGRFCIGYHLGVDCIDARGQIDHLKHDLLTNVLSVALTPDGDLWALRSKAGGTQGLQLVRVSRGFSDIRLALTFREEVRGYSGNGLAAGPDGDALLPVVENGVHRVLKVAPEGRFTRLGDFWSLGGGIAVDDGGLIYLDGVKRPQSLQEQRNPVDVLYVLPVPTADGSPAAPSAAENSASGAPSATGVPPAAGDLIPFPFGLRGSRLTGHLALGGDGTLYLTRYEHVRVPEGAPVEMPVLWRLDLGLPELGRERAPVIDFRIPYIHTMAAAGIDSSVYVGPVMVARGQSLLLQGLNFTGKDGAASVRIGHVSAPIEAWTEEAILVEVPQGAPAGEAPVYVQIDAVRSDPEFIVVKTPDVPGWFQIGSAGLKAMLTDHLVITGYHALITIEGVTDRGEAVRLTPDMETPGLFHTRLENGTYTATFAAAYLTSQVQFGAQNQYMGSQHTVTQVPEQRLEFVISDEAPVVVWIPEMFASGNDAKGEG